MPYSPTPTGVRRARAAGQGLAEFALILPVLLLLLLVAIDFGRLFSAWVTVNNSARVAANYAAANPGEPFDAGSVYEAQVNAEGFGSLNSICATAGVPQPTFADSPADANATTKNLGDVATVAISCDFRVLTPMISDAVGALRISAASSFTIRTGAYLP